MRNYIFIGPPGSGKGTQSALLSKEFSIPQISTGDALRAEVSNETPVGVEAKSYIELGNLVPDNVVTKIIENRISKEDCKNGFILDGFPRNLFQANILEEMFSKKNISISKVIDFKIDDETLIKRISGRYTCAKCNAVYNKFFKNTKAEGVCDTCGSTDFISRKDDNEETVKNRVEVYNKETASLIQFYDKKNLLVSIDGLKKPTLVFKQILQSI
jgi:adenylate kinase